MMKVEIVRLELEKLTQIKQKTLTVTDVIRDITNVLRADPRDLIEHWQGACRYCYGHNHRYQRTPNEYEQASAEKGFDPAGGVGYNPRREPNDACPECFGEGEAYQRIKDTRELSPEQAALYLGVKKTKYGTELVMRSKDAARDAAARYLGMNKENVSITHKLSEKSDEELERIARGEA